MVFMPSVRNLIAKSSATEIYERENQLDFQHKDHKNILKLIDTITIKSVDDCTILQLDWNMFETMFGQKDLKDETSSSASSPSSSELEVSILRTIMETNLTDHLSNIPIFEQLPHSKLELLCRLCHYSIVKEGLVICREGDIGDEVFILLSGEVKVEAMASRRMVELFEEGVLSPLQGNKSGCGLTPTPSSSSENTDTSSGEEQTHSCKRKGSVNFQCDYEPSKVLTKGQKTLMRRRQTLLEARNNCRREKAATTLSNSIKKDVDPSSQSERANLTTRTKGSNSPSPSNAQHRLSRLDVPDPTHSVELARFSPGDYFGEISTFIRLPRAATVTATTNVLMASISKTSFRTLYHVISPHLEKNVEHICKRHMLQTLLQSKSPFLEVISTEQSERMADNIRITTLEEGTVVFNEGDEADKFYFVYSGRLSVEKRMKNSNVQSPKKGNQVIISQQEENNCVNNNEVASPEKTSSSTTGVLRRIGSLYAGDYFGEFALLNKTKRLATITTKTKTTVLLEITRENFNECFQETPQLIKEFIVRMKGSSIDLISLLEYNKTREEFRKYLKEEHEKEGDERKGFNMVSILDCLVNLNEFESMEPGSIDRATLIVETFLSKACDNNNSSSLLSIFADDIVKQVEETLSEWKEGEEQGTLERNGIQTKYAITIFQEVKKILHFKLEEEVLPKFKDSSAFHLLLKRMRAYDDLDVQLLA